jgi:hypothetical protein
MFKRLNKKRQREQEDEESGLKEIKAILDLGGEDEISGESESESEDEGDDSEDGSEGEGGEDKGTSHVHIARLKFEGETSTAGRQR